MSRASEIFLRSFGIILSVGLLVSVYWTNAWVISGIAAGVILFISWND